jgi:AbrB family looped-hinge helix DNA binding protein
MQTIVGDEEETGMKRETRPEPERTVEAVFRGQSRMTARGQITVPTEVRKRFGLKPGDTLCFLEIDGTVVLKLGPLVLTE